MKRKIYEDILKWKNNSAGRTALLIDGARLVGKSYVAKQFAIAEYKSYILIDFSKAPKKVIKLFFSCTDDTDAFFKSLSDFYKTKLFERETLIILDKVQLCPCARSAINHLVADGRYDYIETGTLIPDKKSGKDILPVEEYLKMYPMDFEEFLWAMGEDDLMPVIRTCYEKSSRWVGSFIREQWTISGGIRSSAVCRRLSENMLRHSISTALTGLNGRFLSCIGRISQNVPEETK